MIFNVHTALATGLATALATGLVGGGAIVLAPGLTQAGATDLAAAAPAAAAQPRPGYVVFFEQGTTEISPTAAGTIRLATRKVRANKAALVRLVGRADHAEAVKAELVRQGVQPASIVLVGRDESGPIVRTSTGVAEPTSRYVLIAF